MNKDATLADVQQEAAGQLDLLLPVDFDMVLRLMAKKCRRNSKCCAPGSIKFFYWANRANLLNGLHALWKEADSGQENEISGPQDSDASEQRQQSKAGHGREQYDPDSEC